MPIKNAELMQTVLAIETDEGVSGYYFGGGSHGDQEGLSVVDQQMIRGRIRRCWWGRTRSTAR